MYGLKSPKYVGTVAKGTVTKSQIHCRTSNYVTRGGAKLYIAKSISDEVTHGIVGCIGNMTHDIMKGTRLRRGYNVAGRTRTNGTKY